MVEKIRSKMVKTRKEHLCFGCLDKFPAGTVMSAETNIDNGEIYTLYICQPCREYMDENHELCFDEHKGCYPEGCVFEAKQMDSR